MIFSIISLVLQISVADFYKNSPVKFSPRLVSSPLVVEVGGWHGASRYVQSGCHLVIFRDRILRMLGIPWLDRVIVTSADYLPGIWGEEAWVKKGAVIDLVGRFIRSILGV
jgi:hypothetical protein